MVAIILQRKFISDYHGKSHNLPIIVGNYFQFSYLQSFLSVDLQGIAFNQSSTKGLPVLFNLYKFSF